MLAPTSLRSKLSGSKPGFELWHSPQPVALKIGPSPFATVSGPVNSSVAASKLHSSSGICGEFGESVRASWFAQNSSGKPLDSPSKPVGASVTAVVDTPPPPSDRLAAAAHTATALRILSGRLMFLIRSLEASAIALELGPQTKLRWRRWPASFRRKHAVDCEKRPLVSGGLTI